MAEIAAFHALRYDPAVVGDLGRVTAPPYDVISPAEHEALERLSPYNIVRLILPRQHTAGKATVDQYTRADWLLRQWQTEGALVRDGTPSLTVYEQRYDLGGKELVQRGVLVAAALTEPRSGGIVPHEQTMAGPVEDRLRLLRATQANLEPVFGVYDGAPGRVRSTLASVAAREPDARFHDEEGVEHRAWRLDDPEAVGTIVEGLAALTVVIADGHHRYRTAMEYRRERGAAEGAGPWDHVLMYLVDAGDAGPALLPIHRTVRGIDVEEALRRIGGVFSAEPLDERDPDRLADVVAGERAACRTYALLAPDGAWLLRLTDEAAAADALPAERSDEWRDLDVAVLHGLVFERLLGDAETGFVHSASDAAGAVEAGEASFAVLLAPMSFASVRAIAESREAMPPKSTFFYPKPRNGVAIRLLER